MATAPTPKTPTQSKTPFELRFDILNLAKNYFAEQASANAEFARQAFALAVQTNQATVDQWKDYAPQQYTLEEVIAKAKDLYTFVATK